MIVSVHEAVLVPIVNQARATKHVGNGRIIQCIWSTIRQLRLSVTGISPRKSGFDPRPVHVRSVFDKAVRGQVFLPVLLLIFFHQLSHFVPPPKTLQAGSVVGITTGYGPDGPGMESRWGEIFRTSPDRPWDPPSLLYNGYRGIPGGKERPGRDADPSPPSSAVVKKEQSFTSTPPMGRTACTEPQCLYKGVLYLRRYIIMAYDSFAKKAFHIVLAVLSIVTEEEPACVGPRTVAKRCFHRCRELSIESVVHFVVMPLC